LASNVETTTGSTTPTNCAPGPGIASFGRNIDSGTDCHLSDTVPNQADQSDTNPLIGPLQNNGGSTMTMALLPGSPALDKVPTTGAGCPTTDQRGIPRPQGPACDIGAFELQVQPPMITSPPVISATSGGPLGASTPGPSPVAMTPAAMISASQIVASLARQLHPSGKAAKIAALLGNNGLAVSVRALEAGTAAIAWYYLPPGAKLARSRKPQPTLVASARLTFSAAGTKTAKLKLTFAGKLQLEHAHRIKLTAQDTFTPTGEKAVMVTGTFVLVR
jgi:hypothetical protein